MTYILILFALLMALICLGNGMRKEATKFDLIANMVFSVVFFVSAILILIGGTI
jgi:hypothetical protein